MGGTCMDRIFARRAAIFLGLAILLPLGAFGLTYTHTSDADFSKGTFDGTGVDGSGNVVITPVDKYVAWLNGDVAIATSTTKYQDSQKVAADGSGGAYVIWQDNASTFVDPPQQNIYIQHVDEDGNRLWAGSGVA